MSEFDILEAAFADDLILHGGDENAVRLDSDAGPKPFDAIVGRLRTEETITVVGETERTKHVDVCQVAIRCPAGRVSVKSKITIPRYCVADESVWHGQAFTVRQIVSVTPAWTTVDAWRATLARVQRSEMEG